MRKDLLRYAELYHYLDWIKLYLDVYPRSSDPGIVHGEFIDRCIRDRPGVEKELESLESKISLEEFRELRVDAIKPPETIFIGEIPKVSEWFDAKKFHFEARRTPTTNNNI